MEIPAAAIKELREESGAGVMSCRNALLEAEGNIQKALEILKEQGVLKAQKKSDRSTNQGLIDSYIHGGRIGAIIEVNCETDFVARTDEFKELVHDLAMQVAAVSPQFISQEEAAAENSDAEPESVCLLLQPFIKDPSKTIQDLITETIAKLGENIKIARFARFELGE